MRRLFVTMIVMLSGGMLYALPIGNPIEASLYTRGIICKKESSYHCDPCFNWADAWNFRLGFYGDYIFNRHMEVKDGGEINCTQLYTNAGYFALNLFERIDLFTTLGVTNISFQGNNNAFPLAVNGNNELDLFFSSHFSWSVGARATLWECRCFGVGIEGQYFQSDPTLDRIDDFTTATTFYLNNQNASYSEWQVGLGASYNFVTCDDAVGIIPYIGVKWAESQLKMNDLIVVLDGLQSIILKEMRASKSWGYGVGATMILYNTISVGVEGRFGDERALYVNGEFRF